MPTREQKAATQHVPRYYSREQTAAIFNCSERTVDGWHDRGLIRYYPLPGSNTVRINLDEVLEMLEARADDRAVEASLLEAAP